MVPTRPPDHLTRNDPTAILEGRNTSIVIQILRHQMLLQGCHGHGKVVEFLEKSWNFESGHEWKSHVPVIVKLEQNVMEKSLLLLESHVRNLCE